jgi:O-antigen ligase/Flp pilus assembly protein TadD
MQSSGAIEARPAAASNGAAAAWLAIALPALVWLATVLGGATTRPSQAIVIGLFALLLIFAPPRHSLGPVLNTAAFLFLALAAAAFLPAHWFAIPQWRHALRNDFAVAFSDTLSPQPWMTLDSGVLLVAGLSWIYYVATYDSPLRDIRLAARLFCAGMILLAALCILLYFRHETLPFWHNKRGFGPFPNRNQTGDLFGIATILTLGCLEDDFRRRRRRWILWPLGVAILVTALILNFSRAGILILVIGFAAWISWFAFRRWGTAGIAIAACALLLLFTGLLLFGGETIARFHLRLGSEGSVTSDYRWLIFHDALTMIRASPWCGVGLGNFEDVFALFRDASRGATRSLHPESDWLWVWAEMGLPALVLLLVAGFELLRRVFPLKQGTNQRLRYAAGVGALLFLLHGFVDVSAHRFASFLAGTFLLGLSQARPVTCKVSRWSPILFRFVGLLLVVVSLTWLLGWRQKLLIPGEIGLNNARNAILVANRGHRFSDAIAVADRALKWAPLDWQLYFLRGVARIGERQPVRNAVADFRRARFLEPTSYELPFAEGKAWLGWHPILAATAWREALQRPGALDGRLYDQMLSEAANYDSRAHDALREFAIGQPDLTIKYLVAATPSEFEAMIRDVFGDDPTLTRFSPEQKRRLFHLWSKQERRDALRNVLAAHPEWRQFAWLEMARDHAAKQDFAGAWHLVTQYAAAPPLPQISSDKSIDALEQKLYANPGDYAFGYALYRAQMERGKTDDALNTLRHFTENPEAPAYFEYLDAQAWAAKQDWERAWQSWEEYERRQPAVAAE